MTMFPTTAYFGTILSFWLLFPPSMAALKCHSCYAMGSDRLENCTVMPIKNLQEKIRKNPALSTFDAFDRPTICLKVTMTLEGPGQKLHTVIRVGAATDKEVNNGGQDQMGQGRHHRYLEDFRDQCLSKTRRAGDFMILYQICGCDTDFCNAQPNLWNSSHPSTIFGLPIFILIITKTMGSL